MLTSMGAPSQLGEVLRGLVLPHWRTLSAATVQVTPSALGMAAWAPAAATSEPTTTETTTSLRITSPVLDRSRVPPTRCASLLATLLGEYSRAAAAWSLAACRTGRQPGPSRSSRLRPDAGLVRRTPDGGSRSRRSSAGASAPP